MGRVGQYLVVGLREEQDSQNKLIAISSSGSARLSRYSLTGDMVGDRGGYGKRIPEDRFRSQLNYMHIQLLKSAGWSQRRATLAMGMDSRTLHRHLEGCMC